MRFCLEVDRSAFLDLLKRAAKLGKASDKSDAILSFDGEALRVEMTGMALEVAATGEWDGEVRVPVGFIVRLKRLVPPGDPVEISMWRARFWVQKLSIPCSHQPALGKRIELPLDPTLPEILSLPRRYPRPVIEKSGLEKTVEEAEEKVERMVSRAAASLKTLGVEPSDVRWIVTKALDRYSHR